MNTVATRHPALVLRNAMDTITTELVRADIAPSYMTVSQGVGHGPSVTMALESRADFDSAVSLFGFDLLGFHEHNGRGRITGSGRFLGMYVSAGGPAYLGHRFDTSTIDNGPECIHCHTFANHAAPGEACMVRDAKAIAAVDAERDSVD